MEISDGKCEDLKRNKIFFNWEKNMDKSGDFRRGSVFLVTLPVLSLAYGFKAGEGRQFQPRILTDSHGFKALDCWGLEENE